MLEAMSTKIARYIPRLHRVSVKICVPGKKIHGVGSQETHQKSLLICAHPSETSAWSVSKIVVYHDLCLLIHQRGMCMCSRIRACQPAASWIVNAVVTHQQSNILKGNQGSIKISHAKNMNIMSSSCFAERYNTPTIYQAIYTR